jgi:hypothetical protein
MSIRVVTVFGGTGFLGRPPIWCATMIVPTGRPSSVEFERWGFVTRSGHEELLRFPRRGKQRQREGRHGHGHAELAHPVRPRMTGSGQTRPSFRSDTSIYVRCTPNSDRRFNASASVAKCQQRSWVGSYSIISPLGNAPARLAGRLSASHMTVSRAGSSGSMTRGDCPDHRRQQRDRF